MTILDRLAAQVGIEPYHFDIWGNRFDIPDTTRIAMLEALGLPAATVAEQTASLEAIETAPWRRAVEHLVVVPAEAQPGTVDVVPPAVGAGPSRLAWSLVCEDGTVHRGGGAVDQLPVTATRVVDGQSRERRTLALPAGLPEGYHRLTLEFEGATAADCTVVVAPQQGWTPEDAAPGARLWGFSCQLYSLRSARNWGIGTYRDLAELGARAAATGADLIGINPLHALFPADPEQASPYSPASRDFLTVLCIDPEQVPDFPESATVQAMVASAEFQARRTALRAAELVDYTALTALLLPVLEGLHHSFRTRHLASDSPRAQAFRAFQDRYGEALIRFATFMVLQETFTAEVPGRVSWRTWPAEYHDPEGAAVRAFADSHAERIEFHAYLQWIADGQLAEAAAQGRAGGMRVGLYRDLAVGVGPDSAAAWCDPEALVRGVSVGAPPDPFNRLGQDWGLSPFNPLTLRDRGFGPYIAALRANMRHAGALRIDHVMGLQHLYWVPRGLSAASGAYIRYPFAEMLRLLALESRRHRCLVIGEDLGTVPEGFRPAMAAVGALSYKVLMFERVGDNLFRAPADYPAGALVTANTHDLPPLAGYWAGRDLEWRRRLELYPDNGARDRDEAERVADRRRLVDALIHAGLWPAVPATDTNTQPMDWALIAAIHHYLARTPCRLMTVSLEDCIGQVEQMNLPGTVLEHPNWRRRLAVPVELLFEHPGVLTITEAVRAERGTARPVERTAATG